MKHHLSNDIHKSAFIQDTDPFTDTPELVRAFLLWIDTSGSKPKWKYRNLANDGWVDVGGISADGAQNGDVPVFNSTTGAYEPQALSLTLAGDVTGAMGSNKLEKLHGRSILVPDAPVGVSELFNAPLDTVAMWAVEDSGATRSIANSKFNSVGTSSPYNGRSTIITIPTFNLTGKTVTFELDITNPDGSTTAPIYCGHRANGTTSHMVNGQYFTGFNYDPFADPLHVTCYYQYWLSNGGNYSHQVTLPAIASKFRTRDASGVIYFDAYYNGAWHEIDSYDYTDGNGLLNQHLFMEIEPQNAKRGVSFENMLTDVFTTDTVADGTVLSWSAANNRFEMADPNVLVNKLAGKPVAATVPADGQVEVFNGTAQQWQPKSLAGAVVLDGDVAGTAAASVVQKIRGRNVKNIPLPVLVGDDFEDNSLDTGRWYLLGDNDYYVTYVEAGGRGKFALTNTPYWKGKDLVGKQNITSLTGIEIIFDLPVFGNGDIRCWFGLRDNGANTPAGAGGQSQPDNNFIGFSINQNGATSIYFNQAGNDNNLNGTASAVNGIPKKLRIREDAGVLYYDIMLASGNVWQNAYTHDYHVASITNKVLAVTFSGAQYQVVAWELEAITTTYALSDTLPDNSLLAWKAANSRFEDARVADLVPLGDVNINTNKVTKLQDRAIYIAPPSNVFGDDFSGSPLNEEKWHVQNRTSPEQVNQSGGNLALADGVGIYSDVFNVIGKTVIFDMGASPSGSSLIGFTNGATGIYGSINLMLAYYYSIAGVLQIRIGDGSNTNYTPANAANCRFIKFEATETTIKMSVSADKNVWIEMFNRNLPTGAAADAVRIFAYAVNSTFYISGIETDIADGDPVTDKSLLWWVAANDRYEPVELADLKAALDALP